MTRQSDLHRPRGGSSRGHAVAPGPSYPADLLHAQMELDRINDELRRLFESLRWPADAEGSWGEVGGVGHRALQPSRSRASQGAAKVARLRDRSAELIGEITGHHFWLELDPADVSAAWVALQHRRVRRDLGKAAE